MKTVTRLNILIAAIIYGGFVLYGQATQNPFLVRVESDGQASTVLSGSTINLVAEALNAPKTAHFTFTYRGAGRATISAIDLNGSSQLTIQGALSFPIDLAPGQTMPLVIQYAATSSQPAQALLSLTYTETGSSGPAPAPLFFNIVGTAPEFSLAYVLQADNNTVPVPEGGTILFPTTPASSNNIANVLAINRGAAPMSITAISLSPSGPASEFQVIGLPLLPVTVDPGQAARFTIRYSPRTSGRHSAALRINLPERAISYTVEGSSTGPQFTYELLDEAISSPLSPNSPMTLPDTQLGTTRSFVIRVNNNGDGDGIVQQISALGPGYQVVDLPFLPLTLTAGSSFFFTLNFTPVQPGRAIGRLRVGNDNFEFSAVGLGARLTYSYEAGGISVPVQPTGTVTFNAVPVGRQTQVNFTVTNTGTTEAILAGISTVSANEFSLLNVPRLPMTLQPNERIIFAISFSPTATGPANSSMRIDTQDFNLLGIGSSPPDLPGYRFETPSGLVDPLQQVLIGLTLDAPYPIDINGTVALDFTSASFSVDPALQFATGGRTATFRISANTTSAIFANNSTRIGLQTGTVAGTILVSPAFTVANNFALTARSGDLALNVPAKTPGVLAVEVGVQGNTGMTVFVTGYANSRTLSRLNLQFTPKSGAQLQGSELTVDVSTASTLWFRNANSQNFGGLFTLTIPFSVQGLAPTTTFSQVIDSVSATLTNEIGTSSMMTTKLP
jgi:hypothetical protein